MSSFGYLIGPSKSECGYCKSESTSQSFGIWAYRLTVEQYQLMLDKGWRRSGHYLYKPNLENTCCPTYTIRLDVLKFEASKGQMKVIKKVQKFLHSGGIVKLDERKQDSTEKDISTDLIDTDAAIPFMDKDTIMIDIPSQPSIRKQSTTRPNLDRKSGLDTIFQKILGDNTSAKHTLNITLEPTTFSNEMFELYKKYQIAIHNDTDKELTPEKFKNFLVESPLSSQDTQYGSFHQKYYIDSKLIAVGILDILPNCVSSVYFIYDPDYGKLSLGTFSALNEIYSTMQLSKLYPDIHYYYLGYYIHTCEKMKYKAQYRPSELLCPFTFSWISVVDATPLLDKVKNTILVDKETNNVVETPVPLNNSLRISVDTNHLKRCQVLVNRRLSFVHVKEFIVNLKLLIEGSGMDILDGLVFVPPNEQ